ncbi:chromosomal organization and DNA repair protein Mms21 [Cordyceps fumosorosea ARSEF 2679]|uniref:Chromosomal organization and DNA repair protein Mms21 n=1 Tax=Cordyceps fumosorosea (strain ARSEF 2679) TaxID=1081104 RepID=A0A168BSQ2_CORFA|nr:chromosomal organization and DNA repair protein Mms21 [Cordyceps fumosorosea ARSEF 2679]OAA70498.1 chromosomal organization and DNA repair protein Mms21 [Cordyceps fumosorosea ARSEF 2679]
MSQRLASRARSSTANRPATSESPDSPEYEPLDYPLDDDARRALERLSTNRLQNRYIRNLKASTANLGNVVSDIQERLHKRRAHLLKQRQRRQGKDPVNGEEDLDHLEQHLDDYARKVDEDSREAEANLRLLIDQHFALEDEGRIISEIYTDTTNAQAEEITRQLQKERQREEAIEIAQANGDPAPPEEEEEEEEKPPPPQSIIDSLRQRRADKRREYELLSVQQRYATHNEYASFKKLWHDAAQGEDGPPLADASRWFAADGAPILPTVAPRAGRRRSRTADAGDDSDDDIAVAREVTSLRCPLSLQEFVEPFSNRKCKHTFERSAIEDYLPATGQVQCPQTGCSQTFRRADFAQDFYLDQALLRRLQRRNEQNQLDDMDVDDEANTSVQVESTRSVKRTKRES